MRERHAVGLIGSGRMEGASSDPDGCRGPTDIGKIHHSEEQDIWYECVYDQRKGVYTWTTVPPSDEDRQ